MCLAIPGQIREIQEDALRTGRVAFGEVLREVSLALVPKARVGDYVVVHAGMALEILDEAKALEVIKAFQDLDEVQERSGIAGGTEARSGESLP